VGRRPASPQEHPRSVATGTLRGTPVEEPLAFEPPRAPPEVFTEQSDPPPRPPQSRSIVPIIALAILLGVGAVVALAALQGPRSSAAEPTSHASAPPPVQSLAAVVPTASATADHSASALPPLTTSAPPVATVKHPIVRADAGARPHPSASTSPLSTILPLPSSFPPIPSSLPPDFALPGFGP